MQQLHGRKVIALTRGGLTRVPDERKGIFHRNNPVRDGRMNCKKSAEAIVILKDEGRNNSNLRNDGGVRIATTTDNVYDGYLQENMLETEDNVKACSNPCGEIAGEDGVTHLIYKVMDRHN